MVIIFSLIFSFMWVCLHRHKPKVSVTLNTLAIIKEFNILCLLNLQFSVYIKGRGLRYIGCHQIFWSYSPLAGFWGASRRKTKRSNKCRLGSLVIMLHKTGKWLFLFFFKSVLIFLKFEFLFLSKYFLLWPLSYWSIVVIIAQIGGNPGLQAIWEDEKQRRRNRNETSQISQPESQGINLIVFWWHFFFYTRYSNGKV